MITGFEKDYTAKQRKDIYALVSFFVPLELKSLYQKAVKDKTAHRDPLFREYFLIWWEG